MSEIIKNYISKFSPEVKEKLDELYKIIASVVPSDTEETIGYGIPTFKLNGNLIHFGGFKDHVSLFPGGEAAEVFKEKLIKYKTSKGTIQFPLTEKLPVALIKEITKYRVKQNLAKTKK